MTITIVLPFPPATGNHTTRASFKARRFYTQKPILDYRLKIKVALKSILGNTCLCFDKAITLTARIYPPDRRRRDTDNIEKVVYDALTRAGFWEDDKLIREKHVTMMDPDKAAPRIEMEVKPYAV